jgi:hypothetical protein
VIPRIGFEEIDAIAGKHDIPWPVNADQKCRHDNADEVERIAAHGQALWLAYV